MADLLEDDDPSDLAEHRFGYQEWDKLEENFTNVGVRFLPDASQLSSVPKLRLAFYHLIGWLSGRYHCWKRRHAPRRFRYWLCGVWCAAWP
jgi:hypothetical protein